MEGAATATGAARPACTPVGAGVQLSGLKEAAGGGAVEMIPDFWVLWTIIALMMVLAVIVEVRRWLDIRSSRRMKR
jgi:hypothetical protein